MFCCPFKQCLTCLDVRYIHYLTVEAPLEAPTIEVPDMSYSGRDTVITCKGNVGMSADRQFGHVVLQQINDVS